MRVEELRDRKKFVKTQQGVVLDRLNQYIQDNTSVIESTISSYLSLDSSYIDLDDYVEYRCEDIITNCEAHIRLLSERIFSAEK